jgi:hypothetical protein
LISNTPLCASQHPHINCPTPTFWFAKIWGFVSKNPYLKLKSLFDLFKPNNDLIKSHFDLVKSHFGLIKAKYDLIKPNFDLNKSKFGFEKRCGV